MQSSRAISGTLAEHRLDLHTVRWISDELQNEVSRGRPGASALGKMAGGVSNVFQSRTPRDASSAWLLGLLAPALLSKGGKRGFNGHGDFLRDDHDRKAAAESTLRRMQPCDVRPPRLEVPLLWSHLASHGPRDGFLCLSDCHGGRVGDLSAMRFASAAGHRAPGPRLSERDEVGSVHRVGRVGV